jgi:hypothetical protein
MTAYDLLAGHEPTKGVFLASEPPWPESLFFQKDKGGPIYAQTPLAIQWPAWTEKVANPSGMAVYEISPVKEIIVNNKGRLVRVNLPRASIKEGE